MRDSHVAQKKRHTAYGRDKWKQDDSVDRTAAVAACGSRNYAVNYLLLIRDAAVDRSIQTHQHCINNSALWSRR